METNCMIVGLQTGACAVKEFYMHNSDFLSFAFV